MAPIASSAPDFMRLTSLVAMPGTSVTSRFSCSPHCDASAVMVLVALICMVRDAELIISVTI